MPMSIAWPLAESWGGGCRPAGAGRPNASQRVFLSSSVKLQTPERCHAFAVSRGRSRYAASPEGTLLRNSVVSCFEGAKSALEQHERAGRAGLLATAKTSTPNGNPPSKLQRPFTERRKGGDRRVGDRR